MDARGPSEFLLVPVGEWLVSELVTPEMRLVLLFVLGPGKAPAPQTHGLHHFPLVVKFPP